MVYKSRNLTLYELFLQLQKEYFCAEVRKKIYPRISDKKYYERVMKNKQVKIDDISLRNCFRSIFSDTERYKQVRAEIYPIKGLPNFLYKNEKEREQYEQQDIENYYLLKSEVRVLVDNDYQVGRIVNVDIEKNHCTVKLLNNGKVLDFSLENVTRVL